MSVERSRWRACTLITTRLILTVTEICNSRRISFRRRVINVEKVSHDGLRSPGKRIGID